MAKAETRKLFTTWHKKLGIFSAAFLIFLSITGVLLNHAHDLKLDTNDVNAPFLLEIYGVELPEVTAVELAHNWLSHQEEVLYFGYDEFAECKGEFLGAVSLPDYWIAVCGLEIQLYTYTNQLVERAGPMHGLPQPIVQVGKCNNSLCVSDGTDSYQLNADEMTWAQVQYPVGKVLQWVELTEPPLHVLAQVQSNRHGGEITWERVVMDLHAGRFLGGVGPLFMDAVALLFIVLAVTGIILWMQKNKRSGQRREKGRRKLKE